MVAEFPWSGRGVLPHAKTPRLRIKSVELIDADAVLDGAVLAAYLVFRDQGDIARPEGLGRTQLERNVDGVGAGLAGGFAVALAVHVGDGILGGGVVHPGQHFGFGTGGRGGDVVAGGLFHSHGVIAHRNAHVGGPGEFPQGAVPGFDGPVLQGYLHAGGLEPGAGGGLVAERNLQLADLGRHGAELDATFKLQALDAVDRDFF